MELLEMNVVIAAEKRTAVRDLILKLQRQMERPIDDGIPDMPEVLDDEDVG